MTMFDNNLAYYCQFVQSVEEIKERTIQYRISIWLRIQAVKG
jgi:hypothetical protein